MVRCILYLCAASCCFCLFIRLIAHLDGLFTLSVSFLHTMYVFFYVLSCGLAPPPASLHVSVFSLSLSLPAPPPFSVWCVFDWESCQPFLIGLLLHLMLADWLVLLTSGDVMRSWLAASNLCMISSIDVFLHCVQMMNLPLNSPSFSLLFKGCNIMVFFFFLNALGSKIFSFLFSFVLCANGCIVCVQNCLTTHQDPCFRCLSPSKEAHASNTIATHQQN